MLTLVQKNTLVNMCGEDYFMIGVRIREERTRLEMTQPEFAAIAGVSKRTVIEWEKDTSAPNAVQLSALSEVGIDVNYIITGKRCMETMSDLPDGFEGFSLIPVYNDVLVSAGHGSTVDPYARPSSYMAFRNDWIRSRGLFAKDLKVFITRGDSMSGTIEDKEPILTNTADKLPQDGHIYVIRSGENHWVKRVQRQIDNTLLLISDNKAYPPMPLNLETAHDVDVIGKVVNSSKNFY